MTSRS